MSNSVFDPDTFAQTQVDGAMDDHLTPCPHGDRKGQVDKFVTRQFDSEKDGKTYTVMDVFWNILDDESKKVTGMDKPICRQSIFIDLTPEGALDNSKGRNIQLGALRTALNQNSTGKKWNPNMLNGGLALCHIEADKNDPENYSRVTKVAKAA